MRQFRTLFPTDFVFRTVVMLLVLGFGWWLIFTSPSPNAHNQETFYYVAGGLALLTLFDGFLRKSYQVSYDENAIYWRKAGYRGRFAKTVELPFPAITNVFALAGTLFIKPFEAVVIRAGTQDDSEIILSRLYLKSWDIKALLSEVSARSNAVFEEQVREFMETPD